MKIEIEEKHLKTLLRLIYIGKYVINDIRPLKEEKKDVRTVFYNVYDLFVNYIKEKEKVEKNQAIHMTDRQLSAADNYIDFFITRMLPSALAINLAEKKFGKKFSNEKLLAEELYEELFEKEIFLDIERATTL